MVSQYNIFQNCYQTHWYIIYHFLRIYIIFLKTLALQIYLLKFFKIIEEQKKFLKPVVTVREAIGDLPVLEFQKRTGEYKIITDTPVYRYDPFCDYQVQYIYYFVKII